MTGKRVTVTSKILPFTINDQAVSIEVIDLPERIEINGTFWLLRFVRLPESQPISFQELKQAMEEAGWTFDQFAPSTRRNQRNSQTRRIPVFRKEWPE